MQTLRFLGRGSAFNIKEGNTSAYIKQDDELLLIDCGESIFERIVNNKLLDNVKEVNVLITHLNSDHVGSLSSLIYYCYYIKKIKINVLYPNQDVFDLLKLMGNDKEYNKIYLDDCEDNDIEGSILECINCFNATHINTIKCYSYVLFLRNKKIIYYSGDCNRFNMITTNDTWIYEFYQDTCLVDYDGNVHMSLKKLCEDVPMSDRSKVYCMHIDNDELINKAKYEGFNVVEVI